MRNARLDELQAGIKTAGRNINNLRYADDTTLMAEIEEKLKVMKVKEESEKAGLKLNIQKMKIMTSGPIISWQIDGGTTTETVTDFILFSWAPKSLTEDSDCIRYFLFGRKAMTNSILKRRDITLPTQVCLVKPMFFPVVMYM